MDPLPHPPTCHRRASGVLPRMAALLVLLMTPAASVLAARQATPPAHPDAIALRNGCYVSMAAYLSRFQAEFPHERAAPLTVELRDYDGQHTIAVVSWRGAWWGRDGPLGVFPLGATLARHPDPGKLHGLAADALALQAARAEKRGLDPYGRRRPALLPPTERAAMVRHAAAVLPCASELFWVAGDRDDVPLLFFRPGPDWIAVYDPLTGTARAHCDAGSPADIVKAVATRLGYRAKHVRRDFAPPSGPLLAGP